MPSNFPSDVRVFGTPNPKVSFSATGTSAALAEVIQGAGAPGALTAPNSSMYMDSTNGVWYLRTGGAWVQVPTAFAASVLTTQGDILYRDATGLQRLPAGSAGQVLVTGGAGANPSWGSAGGVGGVVDYAIGGTDVPGTSDTVTQSVTIPFAQLSDGKIVEVDVGLAVSSGGSGNTCSVNLAFSDEGAGNRSAGIIAADSATNLSVKFVYDGGTLYWLGQDGYAAGGALLIPVVTSKAVAADFTINAYLAWSGVNVSQAAAATAMTAAIY